MDMASPHSVTVFVDRIEMQVGADLGLQDGDQITRRGYEAVILAKHDATARPARRAPRWVYVLWGIGAVAIWGFIYWA